jgi:hypothetical protein
VAYQWPFAQLPPIRTTRGVQLAGWLVSASWHGWLFAATG